MPRRYSTEYIWMDLVTRVGSPGTGLYTAYVISCVCPRLLLRPNLEQPTARHELNGIDKLIHADQLYT
jgi:hypothetical protein